MDIFAILVQKWDCEKAHVVLSDFKRLDIANERMWPNPIFKGGRFFIRASLLRRLLYY